ncbi:MAG: PAS domain S-box protein [Chromatiaceae bacterium]|nr:PAS domain S-box protein [Chromatiaceae bacterium]
MANSVPHPSLCAICLRQMLRLRLGALAGQALAYGWVHTQLGIILPIGPLLIIGLGLLGYSLWLLRRSHTPSGTRSCSLAREAVIDLASLAVSLYLTGGAHNPLIILLLLPVIVAAATLQPRLIWLVSSLAAAAYTVLMVFHWPFPVSHVHHHDSSDFDLHVQGMWCAFLLSVVLIAYFVAQLGANLRDRDQELAQVREEALVENSPTGILMMRQGRLCLVNPRLAEILGSSRDEVLGTEALTLIHPEDRERVAHALRGAGPSPIPEIECRLLTRSGLPRWVVLRHAPIQSRGETLTLVTLQDLTERKRLEEELRDLSARLLRAQEEERRRVARDLHDGPCQTLTAVRLSLEAWLLQQPAIERRSSMPPLGQWVPTLREVADELRRIATDLRPAMLDDLGLLATLRWFLGRFAKLHPGLRVRHHLAVPEADIPPALKTPIFRILQEACANAARHSQGQLVRVNLRLDAGWLRLRISDDGLGASAHPGWMADRGPGLGLGSMRERAALSGGELRIRARGGAGTRVEASWPLGFPGQGTDQAALDGVGGEPGDVRHPDLVHQA